MGSPTLRCVRPVPGYVTAGRIYEVSNVYPNAGMVEVLSDKSCGLALRATRFEVEGDPGDLLECAFEVARELDACEVGHG